VIEWEYQRGTKRIKVDDERFIDTNLTVWELLLFPLFLFHSSVFRRKIISSLLSLHPLSCIISRIQYIHLLWFSLHKSNPILSASKVLLTRNLLGFNVVSMMKAKDALSKEQSINSLKALLQWS
jgi:hypothetical protein